MLLTRRVRPEAPVAAEGPPALAPGTAAAPRAPPGPAGVPRSPAEPPLRAPQPLLCRNKRLPLTVPLSSAALHKPPLALALIFPSYLVLLFPLNPLNFLLKMPQPALEEVNIRAGGQDFNHLQNVISSVSIHLTSESIHLCLYMPVPGRDI